MVPLDSKSISGSTWKKILEFKDAGFELPLLILGDFYTKRKEEQNKFLLDVCDYSSFRGVFIIQSLFVIYRFEKECCLKFVLEEAPLYFLISLYQNSFQI